MLWMAFTLDRFRMALWAMIAVTALRLAAGALAPSHAGAGAGGARDAAVVVVDIP